MTTGGIGGAEYEYASPYWDRRWDISCGYLTYYSRLSPGDVCNARMRYGFRMSPSIHRNLHRMHPGLIPFEEFWSLVVSSGEDIYRANHKDQAPKADDFLEEQMCLLLLQPPRESHLRYEGYEDRRREIAEELARRGYDLDAGRPVSTITPPRLGPRSGAPRLDVPDPEEVFGEWIVNEDDAREIGDE